MSFVLRPFQEDAVNATLHALGKPGCNPLVVHPTGAGKSVFQAAFIQRVLSFWPTERFLLVTHVKELIEQNASKLAALLPGVGVGLYSAGLGKKQIGYQITVAGIQSVYKHAHCMGDISIIIVDEAHLVSKTKDSMYQNFLGDLRKFCPHVRVIGMTATPYRLDSGPLTQGSNRIFTDIAHSVTMKELIQQGYLSPLVSAKTKTRANTEGVRIQGGEFNAEDLEAALNVDELTNRALDEALLLAADRVSWIVFCVGVDHAKAVNDALLARGVASAVVTGDTMAIERARHLADFKAHRLRALVSVGVLTTGFDAPSVDALLCLRPTKSPGLWVQIAGRGTRLHPGKQNCIAEGQRVLTDFGLVPIELITTSMRVWDGSEFVVHGGVVFKGEQNVITYAGLTATPDHKVKTKKGWKTIEDCASQKIPIVVAGDGGQIVWEIEGRERGGLSDQGPRSANDRVHGLPHSINQRLLQPTPQQGWLSSMRLSASRAAMALAKMLRGPTAMRKPKEQSISRLRRSWNSVRVFFSSRDGIMDSRKYWPAPGGANRPHRQREGLHAGKSSMVECKNERVQHAANTSDGADAFVSRNPSGDPICGQNTNADGCHDDVLGNHRSLSSAVVQTKRRVWDILNAGPRHCFVVEGLIAHNCMVLDYTDNTREHGPVDLITIEGDGEPRTSPMMDCEECGDLTPKAEAKCIHCRHVRGKPCPKCKVGKVPVGTNECMDCGFVIEVVSIGREVKHKAKVGDGQLISGEDQSVSETVDGWQPRRHQKQGKPDSVAVVYKTGYLERKQWIAFEPDAHPYALRKGQQWWRAHGGRDPIPKSVTEAMERWSELKMPTEIILQKQDKFWQVTRTVVDVPAPSFARTTHTPSPMQEYSPPKMVDDNIPF